MDRRQDSHRAEARLRRQTDLPDRREFGRRSCLSLLTRGGLGLVLVGAGFLAYSTRPAGEEDRAITGRIRRQPTAVRAVEYDPTGQTLAMVHRDGTVRLSDDRGRSRLVPPEGLASGEGAILCLGFSPDGTILACGDARSEVTLWDVTSEGKRRAHLHHKTPVLAVSFSPDGKTLATGSADGTVRLWSVNPAREQTVLRGHTSDVRTVTFAPDGRTLASGSDDGSIRLWDLATGTEVAHMDGPNGRVKSLAFSPDGKTLASGGGYPPDHSGGELVLWDVATRRERVRPRGHRGYITSVAFSPDGKTLASSSVDQSIRLWDPETGAPKATLAGHEGFVSAVAFSPDGRWLTSGGDDNMSGLWDLAAENLAGAPRILDLSVVSRSSEPTPSVALDPSDADLMLTYETSVSLSPARPTRSLPDGDRPPGAGTRSKL